MQAAQPTPYAANVPAEWLASALNELDYGVLLVNGKGAVLHVNRAAEFQLSGDHPLRVQGGWLQLRCEAHAQLLKAALNEVALRGTRRMLTLQGGEVRYCLSVVPLAQSTVELAAALLLVLGRSAPCASLSAYGFASNCGLSGAEIKVLSRLIDGDVPARIAATHQVALSTVRTQIGSIRAKTGAASMGSLFRELVMLPPLVSILGPQPDA
jgi:DNA-binding CsgD family transcriptional regulator